MAEIECRFFSGYKPCGRSLHCNSDCRHRMVVEHRILVVHLGALGAVVRGTALLPSIHRKYPNCAVTWVTDRPADQLLILNPLIDRVLTTSVEDQLLLRALRFDVAIVVDKSIKAAGVLALTKANEVFGFVVDSRTAAILPATEAAKELWEIGLSDQKKFFENSKPETQLMVEAFELGPYTREEYYLPLSETEAVQSANRSQAWRRNPHSPVIGVNTGCSSVIPAKKWTIEYHRRVIGALFENGFNNIVLLGGKEDRERNLQIGEGLGVIQSPTDLGLRDGLISVDACDLIVTGDSLGMHMAIARKKFVVAWFGPTCAHEIDLYDRGIVLQARVPCSPCWKRSCDKNPMCYDQIELYEVLSAVRTGEEWLKNRISSFKQPSSATFASVFPP